MEIVIDENAGFCWGVVQTIEKVEHILNENPKKNVNVLGEIIHNPHEIFRLASKNLKTINHAQLQVLNSKDSITIIRAHGEPPTTYEKLKKYNLEIVDATCPLVKKLQQKVLEFYNNDWQIVIYGKFQHAEVVGLRGVCNDNCVVLKSENEVCKLVDFNKKTMLCSQTTMDIESLLAIKFAIEKNINSDFVFENTICKFVINREKSLHNFAQNNDLILFVAGRNSSNGKVLFEICKKSNPNSVFVENIFEVEISKLSNYEKIGITGATSTPKWYLEKIKDEISSKCRK